MKEKKDLIEDADSIQIVQHIGLFLVVDG